MCFDFRLQPFFGGGFVDVLRFPHQYHKWGMCRSGETMFLFDPTDDSGSCSVIRAMGTVPQNHPLAATMLQYWCALRRSHTSHSQSSPALQQQQLHSTMYIYNRPWHSYRLKKKKKKLTASDFCQEIESSNNFIPFVKRSAVSENNWSRSDEQGRAAYEWVN